MKRPVWAQRPVKPTMIGNSGPARGQRERYWRHVFRIARARLLILLALFVATTGWFLWALS